jgi:DNA repair protein RAD5
VTEIVGDGEEIEVDDGEDLSENDLDMIYKVRCLLGINLLS